MAAYAALYRSWRPHRLADVVGQEHVTRTLRNALRAGHAAHAYLFCGPRGTGKTSTARILAAALNCLQPADGDACGKCPRCQEVASDRLLDVQEIDAASNRGVDDVRALRETVGYAPAAGRHKVYILDEVHMLTDASWNTLLKTLEEPPASTTFVLCTTDARKVLATVVSRCQRFDFRRLTLVEITTQLETICRAEGIPIAGAALEAIARRADGGLRDALTILDQCAAFVPDGEITARDVAGLLGAADDEAVADLLGAAEGGDAPRLFAGVEALYGDGRDMAQVARDLIAALRDSLKELTARAGPDPARVRWHLAAITALAAAEAQMRRSAQPRLLLEVALVQLLPALTAASAPRDGAEAAAAAAPTPGAPMPAPVGPGAPDRTAQAPAPGRPPEGSKTPSWLEVLEVIRQQHPPAHTQLSRGHFVGARDGVVTLRLPATPAAGSVERYRALVAAAWQQCGGGSVRVDLVATGPGDGSRPATAASPQRAPARSGAAPQPPVRPPRPVAAAPAAPAAPPTVERALAKAVALFGGTVLPGAESGGS